MTSVGSSNVSSSERTPPSGTPARLAVTAARLLAWRQAVGARDAGLLIVRIGLAWIFVYHGAETLFGAFGGAGIHGQTAYFSSVAHLHPAEPFAVINGITEFFGGIAVGVGVLGRLAAFGLFVDMVLAMVTVTWAHGIAPTSAGTGYELNLALAVMAAVIVLAGCGRVAVDAAARHVVQRR